ncbi:hypothetical protein COHA_001161 [Chlorella ohadii]|uniref:ER membrane protein complex subunit 7 beta-sandwich domain-containing protein n=1 Tax=Chlorella ohadii TaxID=2649997 RepID=A0AAD5DZV8_9CHLO|nr:hypothetical protein COHA_001161 [Chlorella ohadii]
MPVAGKVALLPDGSLLAGSLEVWLQLEGGRRLVAFPLPDGTFSFARVPLGVHTLGVEHRTLVFPAVKLDVGAARKGKVTAAAADVPGQPALPYPLLLRPLAQMEYFEKRQGFSLIGFLKTPYGMMAGFMLFSVFIMPKLKVDPEEYAEMKEETAKAKERVKEKFTGRRRND